MFCPQCGAEYRPGFDRCADCDVALGSDPPPGEDHEAPPLVRVFSTSEADVIPVIKSLLRGAGIAFTTDGEAMMNLYPSDLLGPLFGGARGEIGFFVPESREAEARELLAARVELPEGAMGAAEPED